uniref:Uncharacterized protein n=1 Tax=Arundo donax TaxID=35708 RepID=A0A0A9D3K6_ARUDO
MIILLDLFCLGFFVFVVVGSCKPLCSLCFMIEPVVFSILALNSAVHLFTNRMNSEHPTPN